MNPKTGRMVKINGPTGKQILKQYLMVLKGGGSFEQNRHVFGDTGKFRKGKSQILKRIKVKNDETDETMTEHDIINRFNENHVIFKRIPLQSARDFENDKIDDLNDLNIYFTIEKDKYTDNLNKIHELSLNGKINIRMKSLNFLIMYYICIIIITGSFLMNNNKYQTINKKNLFICGLKFMS